MKLRLLGSLLALAASPLLRSGVARAQTDTPAAPSEGSSSASSGGPSSVNVGGVTSQSLPSGAAVYAPPGGPSMSNGTVSRTLGSKPATGGSTGGSESGQQGSGAVVFRGGDDAAGVFDSDEAPTSSGIPPVHTVRQGDTLWGICDNYFHNPWEWPRIWGYNPELSNPHWIYPGDQIHMQSAGGGGPAVVNRGPTSHFRGREQLVPKSTVFLRDQGYIDDDIKDVWGKIGGSPEDQMILTEGDHAYLEVDPGHDVSVGQELTIFKPLRKLEGPGGAKGTIVAILGTAKVESWDAKNRVARAMLTESLDAIERGAKIGPMGRRFNVVPPVKNDVELQAKVIAAMYPHALFGQNQLVFIDKGGKDGLVAGNRLFAIVQGDAYGQTLKVSSPDGASQARYEADKPAVIEKNPDSIPKDDTKYPREIIGEIRVLRTRDHTAACLVIQATREFETGQPFVARKGY
jgi:hypothetical protein